MKDKIKEIIYKYSRQGMMCENMNDGQILGIRTGKELELDIIAEELLNIMNEEDCEKCVEARKIADSNEKWKIFCPDCAIKKLLNK